MKKNLLFYFVLLLPVFASAQNDPPLYKDFAEGIKSINTLVFDEHVNILQINTDNENFDLEAVNDQMQVLWKTSFSGYSLAVKKFKGKVLAIVSTDHSSIKGINNTYKAYLVDPKNGKLLAEKEIYTAPDTYMETPSVFTGEGDHFLLAVRETGMARKIHVALPSVFALITINKLEKEFNATRSLQVLEFNEKLEKINDYKPALANGTMINWACNTHGDLFIGWLNGPSIEVYKYDAGKAAPSDQLTADIEFKNDDKIVPSEHIVFKPSETNPNVFYYGLTYVNTDDVAQLGVGKFDFSTNKKSYVAQPFSKASLKALEKSFVPVNKKLDDINTGNAKSLRIKYFNEKDGSIVAALSTTFVSSGRYSNSMIETSLIINGFDNDLALKSQQILPSGYAYGITLPSAFRMAKNKLYIVSNLKSGMLTINGIYGCLDLATGKWDKMELLSKKKIGNSDYMNGDGVLWFGSNYVVSYFDPAGWVRVKFNITLQQNEY